MYDVVGLGELLIDFTDAGISSAGQRIFEQNPGGAPGNFLTVTAHMGLKSTMIGKVGNDIHGKFLIETIKNEGVNTDNVVIDDDCFTTLAFVAINENGEREFSFSRNPGADTRLCADEIDINLLKNTKVFHVGSLSLTDSPAREATYEAVKIAKESNAIISYDPNYRASLWKNQNIAVKEIMEMMKYADVVKVSDEEALMLTGISDYSKAADDLIAKGPRLVAITLGEKGAFVKCKNGEVIVPGISVNAVDTTGAGDSFWGGFISGLIKENIALEEIGIENMKAYASLGNAVASICVQRRGGIPAIPSLDEVRQLLKQSE